MLKPPMTATLVWQGDLRFAASTGSTGIVLDSDGVAGLTPPQALAMALAGCMAIDVVDIVRKGRHGVDALTTSLVGHRLDDPPRRFTQFSLHFALKGDAPVAAVERAIQLSRDKYCSVWHSLRSDIALDTTFEVQR
jgi:putative redox protein